MNKYSFVMVVDIQMFMQHINSACIKIITQVRHSHALCIIVVSVQDQLNGINDNC